MPTIRTRIKAADRAAIAAKCGFEQIAYHLYHHTRDFTAEAYTGLLGTYSDNIAMDADIRARFFADIADVIRRHGNVITVYDTLNLQLARKPRQ